MAFLYQPPRLPYSGTEIGLASNVFCENLSMINGGGAALAADGATAVTTTITIADGDYSTTTAVASSSTTSVNGTGMSANFSFTATGGGAGTYPLTLSIENPGTGYKIGDTITFTSVDIKARLDAATGAANTVSADVVFVLVADGANDAVVIGYSADDNTSEGWQFLLDAVAADAAGAAVPQRIVISAPSKKAGAGIANLERTTTVYANATSTDNAAVPDLALGGACCTAISNNNGTTHLNITVVRFVPTGFTLNDCAMTVRVGDRQLATTE